MPSPSSVAEREFERTFADSPREVERLEFAAIEELETRGRIPEDQSGVVAELRDQVERMEEELRSYVDALPQKLDHARLLARTITRADCEQEMQQRLAEDRAMVRKAVEDFSRERTRYFSGVEGQVIKLSLAIAARVLHREAKIDPLLLSAAVRVALEKVADESETRLRVPASDLPLWQAEFDSLVVSDVKLIGQEGMARGECVLETTVGTVELGIEAQLGEIERGFYDLLQKRPA
ncbi:flagellar assembly protein FliH [Granulicella aggregans]|uniref:Flagellar assembly protein FliH n=1 Tax=Granulicella aggregans TaxID=474949 RepID=A0A7W8E4X3_9BACT|nr:FliH/SctL family protein [Granulicella aggregans]MBB5057620.1 flagellar assembly protein FliH [Granulicella aggregans]